MAWTIEIDPPARRVLRKLDRSMASRILLYLEDIANLDDPRSRGHGLVGPLTGLWRYRVGDHRLICRIDDGRLVVLVLDVGHRRDVYR